MKRNVRIAIVFCLALSLLLAISASALEIEPIDDIEPIEPIFSITQPYTYPDTTSDEWQQMSVLEKRQACYVSEETARNMTAEALVQTVATYPLFSDISAFSSFEQGFQHLCNICPALSVLIQRNDAQAVLEHDCISVQQAENAETAYTNSLRMRSIGNIVSWASSDSHVAEVPMGTWEFVETPNGTQVSVLRNQTWDEFRDSDETMQGFTKAEVIAELNTRATEMENNYSSMEKIRAMSFTYNCHSYAWYLQTSSNTAWMNNPRSYITDGSYSLTTAVNASVVAYLYNNSGTTISHSAIVESATSTIDAVVLSKMGALGLYRHGVLDCPFYGTGDLEGEPTNPGIRYYELT